MTAWYQPTGPLRLPAYLAEPRQPLRAILLGWLTAFLPSLALGALVQQVVADTAQPTFDVAGPAVVATLVLFAPLVETAIMAAMLEVLLRLFPPAVAIGLSSLGWGIAHSLAAPAWGLVIWWPFLVFSTLYVTWSRRSMLLGIGIVFCVHALQNLVPTLLLLTARTI